ncbi:MAG TPA: hypothetical protein VFH31_19040 [Pyrinomonadaceae bacterium]|nr:hypothetical protein [Pyrinomonadaceae bacterium]
MKRDLTNDVLHNPFKNRFNDPVTWRLDEMQAHSSVMRERDQSETDFLSSRSKVNAQDFVRRSEPKYEGRMFASVFALFILFLATMFVLFRG